MDIAPAYPPHPFSEFRSCLPPSSLQYRLFGADTLRTTGGSDDNDEGIRDRRPVCELVGGREGRSFRMEATKMSKGIRNYPKSGHKTQADVAARRLRQYNDKQPGGLGWLAAKDYFKRIRTQQEATKNEKTS